MNVRPWGFWKPVHEKVIKEYPDFEKNKNFKKDMFNIVVGIIWQISLIIVPIYLVIRRMDYMIIGIVILVITTIILKLTWWNKLEQNFGEKKKEATVEEKIVYSK